MTAAILSFNERTFSSLRKYRNYRLFFGGQVVSVTGSWMQRIAQSWFVYVVLTHRSPVALGILSVCQFLPFTALGLFAGVFVDRFDSRRIVVATQASQAVTATALAVIALTGVAQAWHVYVLAALNGVFLVVDVPARQALTYRMVGRDELPNAIALNSSLFNASRIFGPAVAGLLIGVVGVGICFVANAVSFIAVLAGLLAMRESDFFPIERRERPAILRGTLDGLRYVRGNREMLSVLALTLVISTFCLNFNVVLPVLAKQTLHAGPQVYGVLSALFGGGALIGALLAASLGRASYKAMLLGGAIFTVAELLLSPAGSVAVAGLLLFVGGAGFTLWTANANSSLQLRAPDHLRGRVVGLYFYAFNGTAAFGGMLLGWLTAQGGTGLSFAVSGGLGVAATFLTATRLRRQVAARPVVESAAVELREAA